MGIVVLCRPPEKPAIHLDARPLLLLATPGFPTFREVGEPPSLQAGFQPALSRIHAGLLATTYLYSTPGGLWCDWWDYCSVAPNPTFFRAMDATLGRIFRF
ncbi:MAG: hypothetical protein KIT09_05420 [Bryobacteraceae bacterium]|nr:hypothetical protein [Bryobacteraceae bacterium]